MKSKHLLLGITLILIIVMSMSILVACGGDNKDKLSEKELFSKQLDDMQTIVRRNLRAGESNAEFTAFALKSIKGKHIDTLIIDKNKDNFVTVEFVFDDKYAKIMGEPSKKFVMNFANGDVSVVLPLTIDLSGLSDSPSKEYAEILRVGNMEAEIFEQILADTCDPSKHSVNIMESFNREFKAKLPNPKSIRNIQVGRGCVYYTLKNYKEISRPMDENITTTFFEHVRDKLKIIYTDTRYFAYINDEWTCVDLDAFFDELIQRLKIENFEVNYDNPPVYDDANTEVNIITELVINFLNNLDNDPTQGQLIEKFEIFAKGLLTKLPISRFVDTVTFENMYLLDDTLQKPHLIFTMRDRSVVKKELPRHDAMKIFKFNYILPTTLHNRGDGWASKEVHQYDMVYELSLANNIAKANKEMTELIDRYTETMLKLNNAGTKMTKENILADINMRQYFYLHVKKIDIYNENGKVSLKLYSNIRLSDDAKDLTKVVNTDIPANGITDPITLTNTLHTWG